MMDIDKGICRLSVIPVRAGTAEASEMISQLLFGEHYQVLEISEDKRWLKIQNYFDQYEGWIHVTQHYPITTEYFDQINVSDYKICLDITTQILFKKHFINILIGSVLPISTNELFKMEEQLAFNGEAKSLGQRRGFEFLKTMALRYRNTPYLWGGRSPFGIDCSGFTQMVFRLGGYQLKRDSRQQLKQGEVISDFSKTLPGDLAFFENVVSQSFHVGILLDEQQVIHASGKVRVDKISAEGIINNETEQLTHRLTDIRRILK
ncbi:MAG: NlpC/P60 family protein [Candidatus Cyclobacteriaceae bacterium M3_2C_046]